MKKTKKWMLSFFCGFFPPAYSHCSVKFLYFQSITEMLNSKGKTYQEDSNCALGVLP